MEFRTAVVDECDCIVFWCDTKSESEIEEHLSHHPEHTKRCIQIK